MKQSFIDNFRSLLQSENWVSDIDLESYTFSVLGSLTKGSWMSF